jgi:beta-glucosidase
MAMEPNAASGFISSLKTLVNSGQVSENRINDAVRRILRAKFRAGRMDESAGITSFVKGKYGDIGNQGHRDIAREAVRKSLVLLKNDNAALPISKTAKVFVTGSHANNHGYQCGGWTSRGFGTNGWQGSGGNMGGATSIQAGFNTVVPGSTVSSASDANIIVYVTGETPYAEWEGDIPNLTFSDNLSNPNLAALKTSNPGKKIITVFISGRARETSAMINNSDAFVAAWLPGSEGAGIAEVLFGDYNFTGKLPRKWDNTRDYGFGLKYGN